MPRPIEPAESAAPAPPAGSDLLDPIEDCNIFWACPMTGSTNLLWILINSRDRFTPERAR